MEADADAELGIDVNNDDVVDDCLQSLTETLQLIQGLSEKTTALANRTRERRSEGASYLAAVAAEDQPVVELVSRMIDALVAAGARLRRAEARALHQEGATMEEIAQLFGVTRQRVSALLRSLPADE